MEIQRRMYLESLEAKSRTQLTLQFRGEADDSKAICSFDEQSLAAHKISVDIEFLGSWWICNFVSHELPTKQRKHAGFRRVVDESRINSLRDVVISSFCSAEETKIARYTHPWASFTKLSKRLTLATYDPESGSIHAIPSRSLLFDLRLTDEEYEVVKQLPPWTAFHVNFARDDVSA